MGGILKLIQNFLHSNKQKTKLELHRTQLVHKVKHVDENGVPNLKKKLYYFF